jgi:hypothetical protein
LEFPQSGRHFGSTQADHYVRKPDHPTDRLGDDRGHCDRAATERLVSRYSLRSPVRYCPRVVGRDTRPIAVNN